jgi:excisionase family DNA binding protein
MLSFVEAPALTNLSRTHLRRAIEEKKPRARIIGRAGRVKKEDL